MTTLLKILEKLSNGEEKTISIDLPKYLVKDLNLGDDGIVDLNALLKLSMRIKRMEENQQNQKRKNELMDLIFNPNRAVNTDLKK